MNIANGIKTKNKKNLMNEICIMHKKIQYIKKLNKMKVPNFDSVWGSQLQNSSNKQSDNASIFESVLLMLDDEQRLIIENDFVHKQANPNWYLNYWGKSKYYKLKNETIDIVLMLIYG